MDPLNWLFTAELHIGDHVILWREIVGNGFGLASALGGMRRRVWAWPVGIIGNVLLFTVFMGAVFDTPQDKTLWGQAGRQIFFVAVSLWGWYRWRQSERTGDVADGRAIRPRWATWNERAQLVILYAIGTADLGSMLGGDAMGVRLPESIRLTVYAAPVVEAAVTTLFTMVAGGLLPAIRAARMKPVEATRYV